MLLRSEEVFDEHSQAGVYGRIQVVWSRDEVVRVDLERGWVSGPGVTDGLERGSPSQRFQVLGEVVGRHERENVT